MIRIAIIDDQPDVRAVLRDFFSIHPDLSVVGEGGSGRDALELVRGRSVDVLLMDLSMPGQNGVDALVQVQSVAPAVRVLILSGYPETPYALQVLALGASGFLHKNCEPEAIIEAIRTVARGRQYASLAVQQRLLMRHLRDAARRKAKDSGAEQL